MTASFWALRSPAHFLAASVLVFAVSCGDEDPVPPTDVLTITTTVLANAKVGEVYNASIEARGGDSSKYTWLVRSGVLPAGLVLSTVDNQGRISGTPSAAGDFQVSISVVDPKSAKAERNYVLRVEASEPAAPVIAPDSLPSGTINEAYSAELTASGGSGEDYVFSLASGGLPAGLTLESSGASTAIISGTPPNAGTFDFSIRLVDSLGGTATRDYSIEIIAPPAPLVIDTLGLPNGTIGMAYSEEVRATGGTGTYTWSLSAGTLPAGLMINTAGEIRGTPTEVVVSTFTLRVTDDAGATAELEYLLEIDRQGNELEIIEPALPDGRAGVAYSAPVRATGGTSMGYTWSIVQGDFPPGLTIGASGTPSTLITGTPTADGDFAFTLEVRDSVGQVGTLDVSIFVEPAIIPIQITTTTLPNAQVNAAYSTEVTAEDGAAGTYNWVAVGLPNGLNIAPSGRPSTALSGTPTQAGTFTATITVFDQNNVTDTQQLTLVIDPPAVALNFVTTSLPNAGFGIPYSENIFAANGSASGFQWQVSAGTLPPGLQLDAAGTPSTRLFGTPTSSGTYDFTIEVTDSANGVATQAYQVIVGAPLSIETLTLPDGVYQRPYSTTLIADGGSGTGFVWTVTQGVLPGGLTLAPNGTPSTTLTGTISTLGSFTFEIEVRDSNNQVARREYNVRVGGERRYVAWVGDTATDSQTQIYAVDVLASPFSAPIQLNPTFLLGNVPTSINFTKFSPDNSKIAFRGDFTADGIQDLYVVDLTGPAPLAAVKVSGPLGVDQGVGSFGWSPDSRWITYQADQDIVDVLDQYVVNVSGPIPGPPQKVSGTMVTGGDVGTDRFRFSPNSQKIIYSADQEFDNLFDLFVVDLSSGTPSQPLRVNGPLAPADADVEAAGFDFTADSMHVFYIADQDTINVTELYLVDVSGATPGLPVKLNGPLVAGGNVTPSDVAMSPDGNWIAYIADQDVDAVTELFLVDLRGPAPTAAAKTSAPMVTAGDVTSFAWSPDSTRILYNADQQIDAMNELYMVGVGGVQPLAPVKVNAPFGPAFGTVLNTTPAGYAWSPDSTWVAYRAEANVDGALDLFVVPVDAAGPGAATQLNPVLLAAADIDEFAFSPDSSNILFRGDTVVAGRVDLHLVNLLNGTPGPTESLVQPAIAGGAIGDAKWFGNDGIYFLSDLTMDNLTGAYFLDLSQPSPTPQVLHPALPASGDVNTIVAPF
jgi:Tol biopolymer transport system component